MFLISSRQPPASAEELRTELGITLDQMLRVARGDDRVQVTGPWPRLSRLEVDLSGVRIDPFSPPPTPGRFEPPERPGILASQKFLLKGAPLLLGEHGEVQFRVEASDVEFSRVEDEPGNTWLVPHHFTSGHASMTVAGRDLEAILLEGARRAASRHGVTIEETRLELRQVDARKVRVVAELVARKLFVKSRMTLEGSVEVDGQLQIRFSDLKCGGHGMVASLASQFLGPYLRTWEEKPLPVLAMSFPGVQLEEAELVTDPAGWLQVRAEFSGG